jgi:hypothetical protein
VARVQLYDDDPPLGRRLNGITGFMLDGNLLGRDFAGDSWDAWRITLKGAFGEPMTERELDRFRELAERDPPPKRVRELWLAIGRRGGKDSIASGIAAYMASCGDFQRHLRRGERAVILCLAVDRHQAKIVFDYIRSYFEEIPLLVPLVRRIDDDTIELKNGVDIVVATNSFRGIRGRTVALVILDECAYWRSDEYANPDIEVYSALVPALATLRASGAMMIGISTTYRRGGVSAGAKIPHEAAGQSGCAGVKNRQQMAFVGQRQGPGDEGRGALCSGSLCGSD